MVEVIIIAVLAITVFVYLWQSAQRKANRFADTYEKIERERDHLKDELHKAKSRAAEQKSKAPEPEEGKKKDAKKGKEEKSPEYVELKKVKEENFRINKELKDLRKDLRERDSSSGEAQRAIIEAKEETERLRRELEEANKRVRLIEEDRAERAEEEGVVQAKAEAAPAAPVVVDNTAANEEIERLRKELKRAQADVSDLRKELRSAAQAARAEAANAANAVKKDLRNAKRQMAAVSKRAENNHKVFLITRSQLMLTEQRLSGLDPAFKASVPIDASANGIEEALKMLQTREAREAKQREDNARLSAKVGAFEAALKERGVDLATIAIPEVRSTATIAEGPSQPDDDEAEAPRPSRKGRAAKGAPEADPAVPSEELDAGWESAGTDET